MKWEKKGRRHVASGPYTISGNNVRGKLVYLGFFYDEIVGADESIDELKAKIGRHFDITGGKRYEDRGN